MDSGIPMQSAAKCPFLLSFNTVPWGGPGDVMSPEDSDNNSNSNSNSNSNRNDNSNSNSNSNSMSMSNSLSRNGSIAG